MRGLVVRRPWLLTLVLSLAVLAWAPRGSDWPAHVYRAALARDGVWLWSTRWYGGHALPGYGVVQPALSAVLGLGPVAVAAAVAAAAAFRRLVGHDGAAVWFAVAVVVNVLVGRHPFAVGLALGLWALVLARGGRSWQVGAAVLAALTPLASPLAGAFLLLAAAAWLARPALPLLAVAPALGVMAALGEGGEFPYPVGTLLTAAGSAVVLLVALGRRPAPAPLRRGLVLYAVAAVALWLAPNPVGGNVVRLGSLVAGPVVLVALAGRSRALLATLLVAAAAWQLGPVVGTARFHAGDPSARPAYYAELVRYLTTAGGDPGLVEVPFTRGHWEAAHLAHEVPLARGWERQVDVERNAALYSAGLTPASYRAWLDAAAVRWVALPDVPLDPAAEREAALLRSGLGYLRRAYAGRHWTVWEVVDHRPLVSGASLVSLGADRVSLEVPVAGEVELRLRWSRYWTVTVGDACVVRGADDLLVVRVRTPGRVLLAVRPRLSAPACRR